MSDLKPAARKTEWIAHDNSQHIKFLLWATTTILQARYIALPFAWTPAGAALFAGSILVEWAVGTFVLDPLAESIGEALAKPPEPRVCSGSPNVTIQDLPAVRGQQKDKTDTCHTADVEQGSQWVSINLKPASRWGDRTSCSGGATIQKNPGLPKEEVFIGGPPSAYSNTAGYHEFAKNVWAAFQVYGAFTKAIGSGLSRVPNIAEGIRKGNQLGDGLTNTTSFVSQKGLDWFNDTMNTPTP